MGWLSDNGGGIGGAIIGAAGSIFSSKQSADAARENYKHRYQWQVKDLQKAGLNPMLAVGNAAPNVPQPTFENVGEGAIRGYSAAQQSRLLNEQIQATRATGQKTLAEKDLLEIENITRRADPLFQSAKKAYNAETGEYGTSARAEERWTADLKVVQAQAAKLTEDAGVAKLNADLARGELTLQEVKIKYADQLAKIETDYRRAMAEAEALKIPAARAEAAFWANAGELGKLAVFIKSLVK